MTHGVIKALQDVHIYEIAYCKKLFYGIGRHREERGYGTHGAGSSSYFHPFPMMDAGCSSYNHPVHMDFSIVSFAPPGFAGFESFTSAMHRMQRLGDSGVGSSHVDMEHEELLQQVEMPAQEFEPSCEDLTQGMEGLNVEAEPSPEGPDEQVTGVEGLRRSQRVRWLNPRYASTSFTGLLPFTKKTKRRK